MGLNHSILKLKEVRTTSLRAWKLPARFVVLVKSVPTMTMEGHQTKAGRLFLEAGGSRIPTCSDPRISLSTFYTLRLCVRCFSHLSPVMNKASHVPLMAVCVLLFSASL